ncbi:MAG: DUF47 family protein [Clostridia bacterium]|nr:DUF47 family protein [Clostridia bacterium]MBQ8859301.1 DUF47 family protein [Clostridia bacterium]
MAKSDKFYFENYAACTLLAKKAATYLVECLENYDSANIEKMLEEMHTFEHSADMKKHEMSEMLAKAFVTPVDREDLDLLSQQLDNVLDLLEEVLQRLYIYNIAEIEPPAVEYAKHLVRACDMLCSIMGEFENFKKSKNIHNLVIACNDVEEDCDKLYLSTMHELTKNSTDILKTLSWYKIYDCLEACADACEHVSECVGSIIMKNT